MLSNNIFITSGVDYLNQFNSRKCFQFLLYSVCNKNSWRMEKKNYPIPQENSVYLELGTYTIIVTWEMPQILVLWGVNK